MACKKSLLLAAYEGIKCGAYYAKSGSAWIDAVKVYLEPKGWKFKLADGRLAFRVPQNGDNYAGRGTYNNIEVFHQDPGDSINSKGQKHRLILEKL